MAAGDRLRVIQRDVVDRGGRLLQGIDGADHPAQAVADADDFIAVGIFDRHRRAISSVTGGPIVPEIEPGQVRAVGARRIEPGSVGQVLIIGVGPHLTQRIGALQWTVERIVGGGGRQAVAVGGRRRVAVAVVEERRQEPRWVLDLSQTRAARGIGVRRGAVQRIGRRRPFAVEGVRERRDRLLRTPDRLGGGQQQVAVGEGVLGDEATELRDVAGRLDADLVAGSVVGEAGGRLIGGQVRLDLGDQATLGVVAVGGDAPAAIGTRDELALGVVGRFLDHERRVGGADAGHGR